MPKATMHIKIRITMKLNSEVFDAKCGNAVLDLTIPLEFKNRKWNKLSCIS